MFWDLWSILFLGWSLSLNHQSFDFHFLWSSNHASGHDLRISSSVFLSASSLTNQHTFFSLSLSLSLPSNSVLLRTARPEQVLIELSLSLSLQLCSKEQKKCVSKRERDRVRDREREKTDTTTKRRSSARPLSTLPLRSLNFLFFFHETTLLLLPANIFWRFFVKLSSSWGRKRINKQ